MKTKTVKIGSKVIGGGNPILIQSMTNTKTEDIAATVAQINKLAAAGCDIMKMCSADNGSCRSIDRDQKTGGDPGRGDIL